ncbi:alpha/beta-hydrolase [Trametes coccinea BRFM310]|uniref:Alpha/beta-hydrolase n=1 Tax=Trametes coccinea (strain BRFM310) TaxID=1353009 RepID=A0A1Y2IK52_TRAC3|nr:alpha/beta-hydrolase [Trametes coccinea BRFM310]
MTKTAPYGTWTSPITTDVVLKSGGKVDELFVDPITSTIYHVEQRPDEGGRMVIVNTEKGHDVVGKEWNVRSAVHEYGGAPAVAHDGVIYFSNFKDGRVYRTKEGETPEPVTPENANYRYAKFAVHPRQPHLLVAIREDHTNDQPSTIVNILCLINTKEKTVTPLVEGADFYCNPCFTPDGKHIAWLQWFHPDMPWEGAEIHVADVQVDERSLTLSNAKHVAGKRIEISTGYPFWASNDLLLFLSDESGYHNPWQYSSSSGKASPVLSQPVDEDFAEPMWRMGYNFGVPLDLEGKMALFTAVKEGRNVLYLVSIRGGTLEELECPYVNFKCIQRVTYEAVVFQGQKHDEPQRVVLCNIKEYAKPKYTAVSADAAKEQAPFSRAYVSIPRSITVKSKETGEPVHVLYYPPTNPDFVAPEGEKPPAIVNAHGGPTSRSDPGLKLTIQYYTSRGFAWVDVNYGGSSGYGRKYIKRLEGNWGIVDIRDCAIATQQLSAPPYSLIDPQRVAITGSSAGGYTVLMSLCTYPEIYTAGVSSYGISDLITLGQFTHKFESHYLFKLAGGTPDEAPEAYKERSPVNKADKIKAPLLVLQGSLDAVVPPNQAEIIVSNIKKRGGRVEYIVFEGEGHGWRKAENIRTALEKELGFYEDVFGLRK